MKQINLISPSGSFFDARLIDENGEDIRGIRSLHLIVEPPGDQGALNCVRVLLEWLPGTERSFSFDGMAQVSVRLGGRSYPGPDDKEAA